MSKTRTRRRINKIVSYIGIAVLIAGMVSFSGCISSGNGNAKEAMKMVPAGTLFVYADLGAMKDDEALAPMYDQLYEEIELKGYLQGEVKWLASGGNLLSLAFILSGNFEIDEIEKRLEYEGFYTGTYGGEEVWIKEEEGEGGRWLPKITKTKWIVLHKDKIIFGPENGVKSFMSVANGDKKSMYDDADCRDVLDRAGGGFTTMVNKRGAGLLGTLPTGAIAQASTTKKINSKTIRGTIVRKYEDEDAAKSAEDLVRGEYEGQGKGEEVKIKQDHEFITVTEEISIEEALSEL